MEQSQSRTVRHPDGHLGRKHRIGSPSITGPRIALVLSVALYLLYCGLVVLNAVARPIADWDMLAYVASVLQRRGETDALQLHAQAFGIVRAAVTDAQWHQLTTLSQYRVVQARDAEAFVSMLPMYQVKGGYVALIDLVGGMLGPVTAMRVVSLASMIVLMAALFVSFWRLGQLRFIGLLTPVMAMLRFPDLASISAPDALVAALATSAACLIILSERTRPPPLALGLLVTAVLIRPDMLVATTGLPLALVAGSTVAALLDGRNLRGALDQGLRATGPWPWAAAVAGVGAYLAAKAGVNHPGWFAHFMFSFHDQRDTMAGFQPAFDIRIYLSALARVTVRLLREDIWPWLMLSLILCGLFFARLRDFGPVLLGLLVFVLGVWASRTLAFPLPDTRVAAPQVLTAIMIAVALIARSADRRLATDKA